MTDILTNLDWIIIIAYLLLAIGIGLFLHSSASNNIDHFFLGGKNMPWLLAGISMVATTFAADTPLLVTDLVAQSGISGNWLWWNMAIGGMLTVFFFARLWKRSNVTTELEFINLRYGKDSFASSLKYFKSIYLGGVMNLIIMGWVNLAMFTILKSFFSLENVEVYKYLSILMLITVLYSTLSGLKGVIITDAIQFFIAMTGCIVLAITLLNQDKVGGIDGLMAQLPEEKFNFLPSISEVTSKESLTISLGTFFAFVGLQWWASWYPGAEPGGGGYIAQRMMSTKNEQQAFFAVLFFNVAHYCLRPWPWIITALCTLVLYPDLANPADGFVLGMKDYLPSGIKGLLLITFMSAYMSTISTQLNWGTSLLVNDLIKPLNSSLKTKTLIFFSRVLMVILAGISIYLSTMMDSIKETWELLLGCGAGLGMVLILRWYWWRINIWSEISASIIPFIVYPMCIYSFSFNHTNSFYITTLITTIGWIMVTYLTPSTDLKILLEFKKRINPRGIWKLKSKKNIANNEFTTDEIHLLNSNEKVEETQSLLGSFINWIVSIVLIYCTLFFVGNLIFKKYDLAGYLFIGMVSSSYLLVRNTKNSN